MGIENTSQLPSPRWELEGMESENVPQAILSFETSVFKAFGEAYKKLVSQDLDLARNELRTFVDQYAASEVTEDIFDRAQETIAAKLSDSVWDFGFAIQDLDKVAQSELDMIKPQERPGARAYIGAVRNCLDIFYEAGIEAILFNGDTELHNQFTRLKSGAYSISDMSTQEDDTFKIKTFEDINPAAYGLNPQYEKRFLSLVQNLKRVVS